MPRQKTHQVACHKMVASIAREAAGQLYEKMMGDNEFYEAWKKQNPDVSPKILEQRFIDKNWGKCLDFARKTLVGMLLGPYPEAMKEEIMEALELDASLRTSVPTSVLWH